MRILKQKPKFRKFEDKDTIVQGKHCMIAEYEPGKILRIFTAYPQEDFSEKSLCDFHWGDYPTENRPQKKWCRLPEGTIIQNICWMYGLAPRVYEIVGIEYDGKKYFAQIIEDLGIGKTEINKAYEVYKEVIKLGERYGFEIGKEDVSEKDVINGKLVDFNTLHFTDNHLQRIKDAYGYYAKYGKIYYQRVPELDMNNGPRQSLERIKYMRLDEIDFKGKSVLDLGCAGGFFCRDAKDRGAERVLGIDFKDCVDSDNILAAKLLANELGYWDIDYWERDLRNDMSDELFEFDIVYFLSMNYHIGIPKWLPKVTKEVCIFEDNSKGRDALETLKNMFSKVEFIGKALDHGDKSLYRCWK